MADRREGEKWQKTETWNKRHTSEWPVEAEGTVRARMLPICGERLMGEK